MIKFPILTFLLGTSLLGTLLSAEEVFKKQQSQIKGLLVIQLKEGEMAGTATQMNATVTLKKSDKPGFELGFYQEVGDMMSKSSDEIQKFIRVRHSKNLLGDIRIELTCADKFTSKDGPSAAIASALMSDALLTDKTTDPTFAVTVDMTTTGQTRPAGGVQAKISGAIKNKFERKKLYNNNEIREELMLDE